MKKLDNYPREQLIEIVHRFSKDIIHDSAQCEGLLRDYAGKYKLEVHLLSTAVKIGLIDDMNNQMKSGLGGVLIGPLAIRFRDECGISIGNARWALESWATALDIKIIKTEISKKSNNYKLSNRKETKRAKLKGIDGEAVSGGGIMSSILNMEGMGKVYRDLLINYGIRTYKDLLEQGSSPYNRWKIEEETNISTELILEWVNHVEFFRIKGMSEKYADLLEEAGVDNVPDLAQRVPANLYKKMVGVVNSRKELAFLLPDEQQVADWVAQAKRLPRMINVLQTLAKTEKATYETLKRAEKLLDEAKKRANKISKKGQVILEESEVRCPTKTKEAANEAIKRAYKLLEEAKKRANEIAEKGQIILEEGKE